jgi:hypothetical protein
MLCKQGITQRKNNDSLTMEYEISLILPLLQGESTSFLSDTYGTSYGYYSSWGSTVGIPLNYIFKIDDS